MTMNKTLKKALTYALWVIIIVAAIVLLLQGTSQTNVINLFSNTLVFAIPLLLVAMGGCTSEHSGIINLALEGIMIFGALTSSLFLHAFVNATSASLFTRQSVVLAAILIAIISGALMSLLLAFASVNLKADQTITGTAINMFTPALFTLVAWAILGQGQTLIKLPNVANWICVSLADVGAADTTNVLLLLLFRKNMLTTWIAIILFILLTFVLYKTKFGLHLRACGENPQAADSVGINVAKTRYAGVLISGALAGLGGLAFTLAAKTSADTSVSGYGFLALAVMIFGNWKPLRILAGSFFFSFLRCLSTMHDSIAVLAKINIPGKVDYLYKMVPYLVTLLVLVFTSKHSQAPKAEGIPYDKGGR